MTSTNASATAASLQAKISAIVAALQRGLLKAASAVNKRARANLSGGGKAAPWSYPIPARTGNLRRLQQFSVSGNSAMVFNTASYAAAIHNGVVSEWAGRGKTRLRVKPQQRAFLFGAVALENPQMIIVREAEQEIASWT